jgi:hypothetical protein
MGLARPVFRAGRMRFRQVPACAYPRFLRQAKGRLEERQHTLTDRPDVASHRRLSTGRWQHKGNIRACGTVFTCGSCAAYQSSEQVMKALHLAATAATFAAIFSALMLCGAALTATLHKAIASAPAILS